MTCKAWRDRLTDYMEDALPASKMAALEAHLSECPDCAGELAALRNAAGALRALPLVEPPPRVLEMISAALDDADREATVRRRRWSWQQASAVAVAACLMVGFVTILRSGVQPEATLLPPTVGAAAGRGVEAAKSASPALAAAPVAPSAQDALAEAPAGPGAAPGGVMSGMPGSETPPALGGARRPDGGGPRQHVGRGAPRATGSTVRPSAPAPAATLADRAAPVERPRARDDATPATSEAAATAASAPRGPGGPFTLDGVGAAAGAPSHLAAEVSAPSASLPAIAPGGGGLRAASAPASRGASGTPGLTYASEPSTAKSAMSDGDEVARDATGVGVALSFVPPASRRVGVPGTGAITITPDVDIAEATVRVEAARGLKITNADAGGVLYQGRLPGRRRTTLAVNLLASEPGTQALSVELRSPEPTANASVGVKVPGFEKADAPETRRRSEPAAPDISIDFHETPLREALLAVGRTAGLRVDVAPEVSGPRVNARFQRIPADAALRILCEEGQYSLEGAPGGYAVSSP